MFPGLARSAITAALMVPRPAWRDHRHTRLIAFYYSPLASFASSGCRLLALRWEFSASSTLLRAAAGYHPDHVSPMQETWPERKAVVCQNFDQSSDGETEVLIR